MKRKYLKYLKSEHWRKLKQERRDLCGDMCEACDQKKGIHGHHIEYRNLIDCTFEDIILLCLGCHKILHNHLDFSGLESNDLSPHSSLEIIRSEIKLRSVKIEFIAVNEREYFKIMSSSRPLESLALYLFYLYTSARQNTDKILCTTGFAAKGLKSTRNRIQKAKKSLIDVGMIKDLHRRSQNGRKIIGWYIHLLSPKTRA